MNYSKLIIFLSIILSPMFLMAQTTPGAVEYMEELVAAFDVMEGAKWKYLKAVTRGRSAGKVEKRRNKLISEYSNALGNTRKVKSFQGDSLLKPSLIEYLKLTKTILKEDYDKILDLEAIAEESYDDMEAYIMIQEQTDDKFTEAATILSEGQDKFAAAHNIKIVEGERSKRSEKISKASDALDHYNHVFLIFFKSNVQETYFLEAMAKNDITAMDQSANALATFATEGLAELDTVKTIKNDRSLINAAKNVLKFYISETETDLKKILEFNIVQEEFQKAQKTFDAIKKSKRTKDDVNKINKIGEKYNRGVGKINATLEGNNKRRNTTLNNWNKAVSSFFDSHS